MEFCEDVEKEAVNSVSIGVLRKTGRGVSRVVGLARTDSREDQSMIYESICYVDKVEESVL